MLTIRNCDTKEFQIVTPTIFPDGTSQVWKLNLDGWKKVIIVWDYESENEIIWLNQLYDLCIKYMVVKAIHIPYLPFARQDKQVSNESTFARSTFLRMLPNDVEIISFDVHSDISPRIKSIPPTNIINRILKEEEWDIIVYPDMGAVTRYSGKPDHEYIYLEKTRDQLTGKLTGCRFPEEINLGDLNHKRLLIVDDLGDFGGTFVQTATTIKKLFPRVTLGLYVSHGLFHGGFNNLRDSGISHFYTTSSLDEYRKMKNIYCLQMLKYDINYLMR